MEVSIITVNYNGLQDTLELLESLYRVIKSVEFEVVVIDNASYENEAKLIANDYPQAIVVRSNENLGFAGGNNLGLRHASGRFIFLMNNDTYVTDDGFSALLLRLKNNHKIGAVCPKIRFSEQGNPIQFAGYTPLTAITLRNQLIGFGEEEKGQYAVAHASPYMHGAAVMIKRSVIEQAGHMPECYFLYYEELDWSERIKEAGYEIWYEPLCQVFHKESRTTGQKSPLRTFYITRNRMLFAERNLKPGIRHLSLSFQLFVSFPKNCLIFALQRRFDLVGASWRGAGSFLHMYLHLKEFEKSD